MFLASTSAGRLRALLHGELLECRCVPAPLLFQWRSKLGGGESWGDKNNWSVHTRDGWKNADAYPGQNDPGDCAQFGGLSTGLAVVDVTNTAATPGKPASLTLSALSVGSYSKVVLRLDQALTISGELHLLGGKVVGPSVGPSRGALTLASQATGDWQQGQITKVDFAIARGAKFEIDFHGFDRFVSNSTFKVAGELLWSGGNVRTVGPTPSEVRIESGGVFAITDSGGGFGHFPSDEGPGTLDVVNDAGGTVRVNAAGQVTIRGNYRTAGTTTISSGILTVNGTAEQTAATGTFQLRNCSVFELTKPNEVLRISEGRIDGDGIVRGSLALGTAAGSPTDPVIDPGLPDRGGKIRVEGNFHLYHGQMAIHIYAPNNYDVVEVVPGANGVGGNASISGPADRLRQLYTHLMPVHAAFTVNDYVRFLTYTSSVNLEPFNSFVHAGLRPGEGQMPGEEWESGKDGTNSWLRPKRAFEAVQGPIAGRVWRDNGAVAGVFEPGVEAKLSGRTVRLFNAAGTTQLASTTTNANGEYLFPNLAAGNYVVQFDRLNSERFAPQNVGTDDTLDSDADPITGRLAVYLDGDQTHIDAGFRTNTAPIAVDDRYYAHRNTSVSGNVLANDLDPDGDPLTATLSTGPAHGSVSLSPNGSFVYVPAANFVGADYFTYTARDAFGGASTAAVTIIVSDLVAPYVPPIVKPVTPVIYSGSGDVRTVYAWLCGVGNVLVGGTNPSGGTLTAAVESGPTHGTLDFNSDGTFVYTPDDSFVGTDSFTFRPADADGPGEPVLVQLIVDDRPPTAANDTATTAGAAVTVAVLGNDTDADGDTLTVIGASDGLYGNTTVNANGTVTYTPAPGFVGTDVFTYVIDDGQGRLSYATVTVAVTAPTGAQAGGTVWLDADGDGVYDAGEGGVSGVDVQLVDINGNVVTSSAAEQFALVA